MKFKIKQEVIVVATGKRALIVGTKEEPWHTTADPYHRKKILAENDYIILLFKGIDKESNDEIWAGACHVFEREITEYL